MADDTDVPGTVRTANNNNNNTASEHEGAFETTTSNSDHNQNSNGYLGRTNDMLDTNNPDGESTDRNVGRDSGQPKTTHLVENSVTSNGITSNDNNNNSSSSNHIRHLSSPQAVESGHRECCCDGFIRLGGLAFMNTTAGLLKLLQTFIGVVVIGCGAGATMTNASGSALFFLIFVAMLSSLNALFSLLYFEYYGAPEKRGLEMGEMLSNALSSILNFIASFVFLLTVAIDHSIPGDGITIATLIFAWILTIVYSINFFRCLKEQKRKNQRISTPVNTPEEYEKVRY